MNVSQGVEKGEKIPPQAIFANVYSSLDYMMLVTIVGPPMLIYFKKLDASATVLSLVVSLFYLLDILQIPAARFVEKIGYRKFVLKGLFLRAVFVFFIACSTALPLDNSIRAWLILALLFCFNAIRSVSYCGVLPWLTHLVPSSVRGKFVMRDQMFLGMGMVFINVSMAAYFYYFHELKHFVPLFFFSSFLTLVSLVFLSKVPGVPVERTEKKLIPWRDILHNKKFCRLLIYNVLAYGPWAGGMVFYVPFLKDMYGVTDSFIVMLSILYGIVSIFVMMYGGKFIDRVGSLPVLTFANMIIVVHFLGWCAIAGRFLPLNWWTVLFQQATAGTAFPLFNAANLRVAMAIVPKKERSHYFAFFTVTKSMTMGISPVLWGLLVDKLNRWKGYQFFYWNWNVYSIFYVGVILFFVAALIFRGNLEEIGSMSTAKFVKELFVRTPMRAISRFWYPEES